MTLLPKQAAPEPTEERGVAKTIGLAATGGVAAMGLSGLIQKADDEAELEMVREEQRQETIRPPEPAREEPLESQEYLRPDTQPADMTEVPVIPTGLASLVSELPENLGSYTVAFVSSRQEPRTDA